jgi:23S rRNA pseudouridine1911/1915/1917 synthase
MKLMLLMIRRRSFSHLSVSDIIFEDNHLIVMNKPSHVLSQGDYSNDVNVVDWLKGYLARKYDKKGNVYVGLIHRLDKGASGLLITTKTSKAASRLHDDMISKRVNKKYLCIVHGHLVGTGRCLDLLQKTKDLQYCYS